MLIFCYISKSMIKNKKSNKKPLIIIVFLVLALTIVSVYLITKKSNNSTQPANSTAQTEDINLNPPTEQDKKEADQRKVELSQNTEGSSANGIKTVIPFITSWGQSNGNVEVAARVPGIIEEGGTCTLTLKSGNTSKTGTSVAISNVSEVSCGFIPVPRSSLSTGEWIATVGYSSAKAKGMSESKTIMVN